VMNRDIGMLIMGAGMCLLVAGLVIFSGGFTWFGRLPGDIRYEGERAKFYVPIVSMLLVSIALSLLFYLLRRFF
jgi:hypothetical protein